MGRLSAIVRKEFLHIRRDSRTLGIMFLMPVIQMILLGYVATTNVEHLRTAVLDRDCTFQSRELIDVYRASNYFDIIYYVIDESTLLQLLDSGKVRAGMIIPAGYEEQLLSHRQPQIAFLIDGSDPFFILLPSIFLSGFFFPLEAMPVALRAISYVIPLRYFLIIVRSIVLKGVGLSMLTNEVIALCIFGPVLMVLATRSFRKRLE